MAPRFILLDILTVAAGGAIGASLRHLANVAVARIVGFGFPWGTLLINVAGCFAMGVFIEILARRFNASNELRLFVATGVLGGFTTFSAFGLDFAVLWERGALAPAFGYAFASVIGSLASVFLGLWLARGLA
jgi:CrcB protein